MNTENIQDEKDKEVNDRKSASSAKELKTFNFGGKALTVLSDDKVEPWFIAKEVAELLDYSDPFEMTKKLDDDEVQNLQIAGFGNRGVNIINESGLWSSVLRSNKPEAKAIKKWLTSEVLPSIRKTGSYSTNANKAKRLTFKSADLISKLIYRVADEKDIEKRHAGHDLLMRLCDEHSLVINIQKDLPKPAIHRDVLAFWQAYDAINQHGDVNHLHDHIGIAINIPYFYQKASQAGFALKPFKHLVPLLKAHPDKPLQLTNHALYSQILKKTVRCAVFEMTNQ